MGQDYPDFLPCAKEAVFALLGEREIEPGTLAEVEALGFSGPVYEQSRLTAQTLKASASTIPCSHFVLARIFVSGGWTSNVIYFRSANLAAGSGEH